MRAAQRSPTRATTRRSTEPRSPTPTAVASSRPRGSPDRATATNVVYASHSEDTFHGTAFVCNKEPGELFLTGGCDPAPEGPVDPGPYIAKADATTGRQIWRTYLENANVSGKWIGGTNLNILADGHIVTSWCADIARHRHRHRPDPRVQQAAHRRHASGATRTSST